jgi:hypothetical protein
VPEQPLQTAQHRSSLLPYDRRRPLLSPSDNKGVILSSNRRRKKRGLMFSCKLVCVLSHKREPNTPTKVPHPDVWLKFLDNIVSAKGDDDTVSLLRELGMFNETLFKHILSFRLLFNEVNTIYRWISSTAATPTLTLSGCRRRCSCGATGMKTPTHCWR